MEGDPVTEGFEQQVEDHGLPLANFEMAVEDLSICDFISMVQSLGMTLQCSKPVDYIFPCQSSVRSSGFGISF